MSSINGAPDSVPLRYWRQFDELALEPDVAAAIDEEFGAAAPPPSDGISRRRWLQLMGASLALGGMAGCRYPNEIIAPFAFRPQNRVPGMPENYATTIEWMGVGRPLLAKSMDGRPIKLDGNPEHPLSRGQSDHFIQSMVLDLYDPDRSRFPTVRSDAGEADARRTWAEALDVLDGWVASADNGTGLAILAEPSASPTVNRLRAKLVEQHPTIRWFEYTSVNDDHERAGTQMAFGRPLRPHYGLDVAKVIVTVDADLLAMHPAAAVNGRRFVEGRNADNQKMSRLYAVEAALSSTGAVADHRLALPRSRMAAFLAALEAEVDQRIAGQSTAAGDATLERKMLAVMAQDLVENREAGIVAVGWSQPAEVHARAWRINSKLGNLGTAITFTELEERPALADQLRELVAAIEAGQIQRLVILHGNPAYDTPADIAFPQALAKVEETAHLSLYANETSALCQWRLSAAHPLESWGDALAQDGSWCIAQPLIAPLFGGYSTIELLARMTKEGMEIEPAHDAPALPNPAVAAGAPATADAAQAAGAPGEHAEQDVERRPDALLVVQETARTKIDADEFERDWNAAVHLGFISDSAAPVVAAELAELELADPAGSWDAPFDGAEVVLVPSASTFDGRAANNGWLQELPDFITKLTWDNAALVSPRTAQAWNVSQNRLVKLRARGQEIELPVHVVPGTADHCVVVAIGYGRTAAGRVGGDVRRGIEPVGRDVRPWRAANEWYVATDDPPSPTRSTHRLAVTQEHFRLGSIGQSEIDRRMGSGYAGHGSSMLREGTYDDYLAFQEKHRDDHANGDDAAHAEPAHDTPEAAAEAPPANNPTSGDSDGRSYFFTNQPPGHHAQWPEGHHLHFRNFDITPPDYENSPTPYRWGMAIDLNKCIGCNACVTACQAENNIPVVGKEQVLMGREMQWMRIDRYFITETEDELADHPRIAHQPVTCQQCEKAPCETVCPVAATTHSQEGLNDMVYNRCVGTRYCSNNCPYKVRRFNYLNFSDAQTFLKYPDADKLSKADRALYNLVMNPEVTIRSRGVMEKCTFCVQRIQNTRIKARNEGRSIGGDEVQTACQQACPTQAIEFGDIANPTSRVAAAHRHPRAYTLLDELNVLPRNRYLARVRNPHPSLAEQQPAHAAASG